MVGVGGFGGCGEYLLSKSLAREKARDMDYGVWAMTYLLISGLSPLTKHARVASGLRLWALFASIVNVD